jgi:hypothetical protein
MAARFPAEADVHGNAEQPGAEGGVAAEAGESAQGAEKGLLHRVFGIFRVAQDPGTEHEERLLVPRQQLVQGGEVAGEPGPQQRALLRGPALALTHNQVPLETHPWLPRPDLPHPIRYRGKAV